MRVFRHNLSGGVLGRDLHYRADLESYQKGNLRQENFLPTPYGGVMRRPPAQVIAAHGGVDIDGRLFHPEVIRYFDFIYDRAAQYIVALISYSAEGEKPRSRFEIFDRHGGFKAQVDAPYAAENFNELCVKQLNDVMYLAHNGYDLMTLVRNGDADWALERAAMKGGPWMPWNSGETTLSLEKEVFEFGKTYPAGYVVHSGITKVAITGGQYQFWYETVVSKTRLHHAYYVLRLWISGSHTFKPNDLVVLSGFTGNSYALNKPVSVVSAGTGYIDVNTGRSQEYFNLMYPTWYNDVPLPNSYSSIYAGYNSADSFFVSKLDGNLNNGLPSSGNENNWWRRTFFPGELTVKALADTFDENCAGQKIFMTTQAQTMISGNFTETGASDGYISFGNGPVTIRTEGGVWGGVFAVQKSLDGGVSWETLARINGASGKHNGEQTVDIEEIDAVIRVYMEEYIKVTGATGCMWQLELPSGSPFIMEITEYIDARTVKAYAETALSSLFQSKRWRLGAFSERNGYPGVVLIHDERMMLGGSKAQPFMVWGSAVNNWEMFAEGMLETSPIAIQANADRATLLCWMASKGELLFGTDFNEYSAGSRDSEKIMSGMNPPKIQVQNSYSSAPIQALLMGEDVFFVQTDRKTMRTMVFSDSKWGYSSQNVTIFNPEIAGSGFRQLAIQQSPFPIIWAVTEDERLVSFTYDKESNIMGWAEHSFGGCPVETMCVLPAGSTDEIVLCVVKDGVFSMVKMSYSATKFSDELRAGASTEIESLIQPTSLVQNQEQLEERRYRITKVFLYLKKSRGGEVSADEGASWVTVEYPDGLAEGELFSGKIEVNVNSGVTEKAPVMIRTRDEFPFNLLSIGADVDLQTTKE